MRKVLLTILTILLLVMTALCMKNGIKVGSLQVLGFQGLADESQRLTEKISEADTKEKAYQTSLSKIETDAKGLASAKKDYLDLVSVSSASDIQQALQTKTYTIEYLWSRVGNHATSEGVTVTMKIAASTLGGSEYRNLNFTVTGKYLAITNFIYSLENDSNLDFTIDNFDMKTNVASFIVKDVKIITENTTVSVGSQLSSNNTQNTSTSQDQNTSGTAQNGDTDSNNTNTSSDANHSNDTTDNSTSGNSNQ